MRHYSKNEWRVLILVLEAIAETCNRQVIRESLL